MARAAWQRSFDASFEIVIGLQVLVDHEGLQRGFIDRHNGGIARAAARRVPGYAATHQQHQVAGVQERFEIATEIERVVAREVGVAAVGALNRSIGLI
jgi:hypothetical protein